MTFDVTNPAKPTIVHDPDAVLDYLWDFTNLIDDSDLIESAIFKTTLDGVTVAGVSATLGTLQGKQVWGWVSITDKVTLSGLTIGVTCEYTTFGGRVDDRTLYFKLKER